MAVDLLVTVALYHRDTISRGNSRRIFGYESYHWGLVLMPDPSSPSDGSSSSNVYAFDATDASDIDPVTFRLRNPTMDWWLRAETNPPPNAKLIGQLVVGSISATSSNSPAPPSMDTLKSFFEKIPLPIKNTHPQQSCVTWAVAAVGRLQDAGWARPVDLTAFKDAALAYADERMKGDESTESAVKHYTV